VKIHGDPPPARPSLRHPLGTDDRGRDVLARLAYGFRISMTFALLLALVSVVVGIAVGAVQGYFGGWIDLFCQRAIEIWTALPLLYVVLMVSSIVTPNFWILIGILALFRWIPLSRYVRAEVLRERGRDYVTASRAQGATSLRSMFVHVLPNSLTPVIALFPFTLVASIFALTSLDYLGFGLPAPTPSWGELFKQGQTQLRSWWLTLYPFLALFLTLLLTTFVGEAMREAWDPRDYHRREE
jgi:microcin C transport system permease protein